jgi:predicted small secreted protein
MVRKLVALLCAASFVMLTACNTMEGAGKDIQRGGEKVESAADKNKK